MGKTADFLAFTSEKAQAKGRMLPLQQQPLVCTGLTLPRAGVCLPSTPHASEEPLMLVQGSQKPNKPPA